MNYYYIKGWAEGERPPRADESRPKALDDAASVPDGDLCSLRSEPSDTRTRIGEERRGGGQGAGCEGGRRRDVTCVCEVVGGGIRVCECV